MKVNQLLMNAISVNRSYKSRSKMIADIFTFDVFVVRALDIVEIFIKKQGSNPLILVSYGKMSTMPVISVLIVFVLCLSEQFFSGLIACGLVVMLCQCLLMNFFHGVVRNMLQMGFRTKTYLHAWI